MLMLMLGSVCFVMLIRRDSFITHRAFCDALAQESARSAENLAIANSEGSLKIQTVVAASSSSSPPPPPLTPSTGVLSPVLSIQSSGIISKSHCLYCICQNEELMRPFFLYGSFCLNFCLSFYNFCSIHLIFGMPERFEITTKSITERPLKTREKIKQLYFVVFLLLSFICLNFSSYFDTVLFHSTND